MTRRWLLALAFFIALALCSGNAQAETCSASPSGVVFGTVSPIRLGAVAATGTINITCTWSDVTLTPSVLVCLNFSAPSPRTLVNGSNTLLYDLYVDAGHTVQWGSATAGGTPISVTMNKPSGTTLTTSVTVYGQIAANQPTVPTVNNASTTYTRNVTAANTSLNYSFYLLLGPTCPTLTTSNGSFPFTVSANVINDCTITASNVGFAPAGVLNAALNANGSISARCTNGDAFRIALNGGSSGNVAARQMQRSGGGGAVNYQLYLDSTRLTAWGDGTAGTSMATGSGSGNQQVITVYGQVPAQSTPAPGSYSDTITATISF